MNSLIEAAAQRLAIAKGIAEQLKHHPQLHRLSMETVFVLEDTLATLKMLKDQDRGSGSPDPSPSL